jgi:hypothetical protein
MPKLVRGFLFSWLIWEVIVGCAVVGMYLVVRRVPTGSDVESFVTEDLLLGLVIVGLIWLLCRSFGGVVRTLVGLVLGLLIPIAPGWIWGQWFERYVWSWGLPFNAMGLWIGGLELAIPSALAGGIVGYFMAHKVERAPVTLSP